MIGSVSSNHSSCYSSSSTSSTSRGQQLQKELFAKLDSNGDGAVDQDELKNALSQKSDNRILVSLSKNFSDLDTDGNGSLSSDEMAAMAPPAHDHAPNTELADALLSALDSNGDGVISSDELNSGLSSAGSKQIFSALDKNQDGTVSLDELAASLAPPQPPQQGSGNQLFSQLDSDSDGSISATELSSALQASDNGSGSNSSSALLKILDSDSSAGISSEQLKATLHAGPSQDIDTQGKQASVADALGKMIANLSKQYQLNATSSVGGSVNVAA
ncbi:XopAW family type III secretion system calcium-binding effector [Pseudomonas sp. Fl4BN1]|uniref:XopAW family type III secretion system calcium-binding effector n=1 Tax=Pseudomonas sp. Fl4BN1 TaxID=2697651 RepID=UPI00137828C0|nr:XopAW family type III secretion system calcium-binding effector [Pseudomonas sp. Fl4BN1]NBF08232.1 histidine kinase [Pseudomonas sp. Fl4BN1]